jgi:ribonuclease VapC
LIAVDASALIAIALVEPEEAQFLDVLRISDGGLIAPVNYVEVGVVLRHRRFVETREQLDGWLAAHRVEVDEQQSLVSVALDAYHRFGKGRHPARLNLADCFAYALAKQLDAPLLYKGDDFAKTDIRSALQPT